MLKAQEIERLRECAEKLGADSYCGPWLIGQLPFIEHDMRCDIMPTPTWTQSRQMHDNILLLAEDQAQRKIKVAEAEAERILKEAKTFSDSIRRKLASDLNRALESIE